MSNANRTVTLGDVRDEKALYWANKFAQFDATVEAENREDHEKAMLAKYPEIGVLQGAKGRKFYVYIDLGRRGSECFRSSNIDKVVDAVERYIIAGEEYPL